MGWIMAHENAHPCLALVVMIGGIIVHRRIMHPSIFHFGVGILFLVLTGLAVSNRAYAEAAYTLTSVQYGMELKTPDGRVVFRYMTTKPEDIGLTSPSVACFHPVFICQRER